MKKKAMILAFSVLCATSITANDWHGYIGMGGEVENGRVTSGDADWAGFGKASFTLTEFSVWNNEYPGYSLFGKVLNTTMTNEDLRSNGANGYLIELWPTYTKHFNDKTSAWLAIPFKSEQYSATRKGDTYAGYNSFGIAPGLSYNFTNKFSGMAKTYYKYDVQNSHSNGTSDNFLETEAMLSYKLTDNVKFNIGYLYKFWKAKDQSEHNGKKKNIDENIGKTSLNIWVPKYNLSLTPFAELGGYYDEFHSVTSDYIGKYNERDSYKLGLALDKKINDSWKVMGELSYRHQKVDNSGEKFSREIYFGKVIVAYTF